MDLFAGCGGLTRGFVDSRRFESVLAVEVNRDAASTYRANFRRHSLLVSRIEDVIEFPAADVVVGGPPCQPFSPLNRSGAGLERRSLWREYLRALRASGANGFVMENVPQLLKSKEYESFRRAVVRLGFYRRSRGTKCRRLWGSSVKAPGYRHWHASRSASTANRHSLQSR